MRWELIDTIPNALVGGVVTAHGPTSYSDIIIVYKGTNQVGQTADLNDVAGMLTIKHAGSKSRRSLGLISSLNRSQSLLTVWENWRGRVAEASVDGDKYRGVIIVPFHLGLNGIDRNVLYSGPGERLVCYIPPIDPAGAHLDPAEQNIIEVYGVMKHAGMMWVPRLQDRPITLGGNQKESIPPHTACLVLSEYDTPPTEVRVVRGSELMSEGSWDGLYYGGQMYYHNDSLPYLPKDLYLDFTDLGYEKLDALGSGQHIILVGGTGTIVMFSLSLDMEHAATQTIKSAEHYTEEMIEKVSQLTAEGIPPVQIGINMPEAVRIAPHIALALQREAKDRNVLTSQVPISGAGYNSLG